MGLVEILTGGLSYLAADGSLGTPLNLRIVASTATSVTVAFDPPNDTTGIDHFVVHCNGLLIATIPLATAPESYTLQAYLDGQEVDFVDLVGVDGSGTIVVNIRWPETIQGGEL